MAKLVPKKTCCAKIRRVNDIISYFIYNITNIVIWVTASDLGGRPAQKDRPAAPTVPSAHI